jgi:CPA2 family monovalent cation:H+ antiporter-2
VTSGEVLESLGLKEARELVLAINDPGATERSLRVACQIAPNVPVFVRTQYAADVERLLEAGAADVIAAEIEASTAVTRLLLARRNLHTSGSDPEASF